MTVSPQDMLRENWRAWVNGLSREDLDGDPKDLVSSAFASGWRDGYRHGSLMAAKLRAEMDLREAELAWNAHTGSVGTPCHHCTDLDKPYCAEQYECAKGIELFDRMRALETYHKTLGVYGEDNDGGLSREDGSVQA